MQVPVEVPQRLGMLKLRLYVGRVKTPVLHIVVQILIRGDSSPNGHLTKSAGRAFDSGSSLALGGGPGQAVLNVEAMLQWVNYPNKVQVWKRRQKVAGS